MPTRRQQKLARVITGLVSEAITSHLNDPRIQGLVSVTRTKISADLRKADVYVSIRGKNESAERETFAAIRHARNRIQAFVADEIQARFCPSINLHLDEQLKRTLETMRIISEAVGPTPPENADDRPEDETAEPE